MMTGSRAQTGPTKTVTLTRGLDASSVQGLLPFAKLAPDLRFVILKAQQGNDGFDPAFATNAKAARERGLQVFAYCFLYPLPKLDPKAQAKLFVDKVSPTLPGRPLFLDCEWPEVVPSKPGGKGWKEWGCTPPQIATWMRDCAAEVHRLSGVAPVLYTYPWWWAAVRDGVSAYGFPTKGDVTWAKAYGLWLASYRTGWPKPGDAPKVPAPWSQWTFWQFDGNGGLRLPNGIDCDFCVFRGDDAALTAFAAGEGARFDLSTVRGIQLRLLALGFDPGPIDGASGPKTVLAIQALQRAKGLVADGIVGPKTLAALAN